MAQDLDAVVMEQDAAVVQIEQKGEQVTENVGKANQEISGAIVKARSRNRKKWWCLLIVSKLIWVTASKQNPQLTCSSPPHHCHCHCGHPGRCPQPKQIIRSSVCFCVSSSSDSHFSPPSSFPLEIMLPCRLPSSETSPFRSLSIDSSRQCIHFSYLYFYRSLCKIGPSLSSNIIIVFHLLLHEGIHDADTAYTTASKQHESYSN